MLSKKFLLILALSVSAHAQNQLVDSRPKPSTPAQALSASENARPEYTRVRVSVQGANTENISDLQISTLSICTIDSCYESGASKSRDFNPPAIGNSTQIASIEVPKKGLRLTSAILNTLTAKGIESHEISLRTPLDLDNPSLGGDLLVTVDQRKDAQGNNSYVPTAISGNFSPRNGVSIHYHPSKEIEAALEKNVVLGFPSGATNFPEIFIAASHDTGDEYPLVDLYPEVNFTKKLKLTIPSLNREESRQFSQAGPAISPKLAHPNYFAPEISISTQMRNGVRLKNSSPNESSFEIDRSGIIRRPTSLIEPIVSPHLPYGEEAKSVRSSDAPAKAMMAAANQACLSMMSDPAIHQAILNGLAATGTVELNWCVNTAPYMHMAVVNMNDARERLTLAHLPKVTSPNDAPRKALPLKRLTQLLPIVPSGYQVLMNGFTWSGGSGNADNQYGYAQGHVSSPFTVLGSNIHIGGACGDYSPWYECDTGVGANVRVFQNAAYSGIFSWNDVTYAGNLAPGWTVLSSSTSVVKNGVCMPSSNVNQWSVFGSHPSGYLIFLSSASGTTTSMDELCPVLQALGVNQAIRMDGSSSAGIVISGNFKNPLTGLQAVYYGPARYVAYGIKVAYQGW